MVVYFVDVILVQEICQRRKHEENLCGGSDREAGYQNSSESGLGVRGAKGARFFLTGC